MGADAFVTMAQGKTAKEAFRNAVADAQHQNGHGGYTGTIAEKREFVLLKPKTTDPLKEAWDLIHEDDERISDKWGPAGCFDLGDNKFVFFGLASS